MTTIPTPRPGDARQLDADIHRLETALRQLKIQYDMFFSGALPREPIELRSQVEALVRRWANSPIQKYAQAFHLGTLVSRFNSLSELWGKTLRSREEGPRQNPVTAAEQPVRERLVGRTVLGRVHGEDPELRRLYDRYVEARRRTSGGGVPYEKFVRGIAAQTDRLRKQSGCAEIELRVVVAHDKVHVKARPGRT